jgi:urea transport system substrate-binding protein
LLLGSGEVSGIVAKIVASKPDIILNSINGDSNRAFFRALRAAGITPAKIPTVSFSIAEPELRYLSVKDMVGDYAAWNYFQSIDQPRNRAFIKLFQPMYGPVRETSDPMEAGYFGVHLWAQAVRAAGSDDVRAIRKAMMGQEYDAPGGPVRIDPETQHTWKTVRLGRIIEGGQFEIVWSSEKPVRPVPFPPTRSRAEWNAFLRNLSTGWGGNWANPAR